MQQGTLGHQYDQDANILISFLEGFNIMHLPVAAFGTLLATTTANILGLAYIVLKGMFPPERNS